MDKINSYRCGCAPGYTGANCETAKEQPVYSCEELLKRNGNNNIMSWFDLTTHHTKPKLPKLN